MNLVSEGENGGRPDMNLERGEGENGGSLKNLKNWENLERVKEGENGGRQNKSSCCG